MDHELCICNSVSVLRGGGKGMIWYATRTKKSYFYLCMYVVMSKLKVPDGRGMDCLVLYKLQQVLNLETRSNFLHLRIR